MNVDIIKAVVWAVITLALIGLLVKFWRADRQQVAKLKELEAFKERYRCEMVNLYRWFASDTCTLQVLDWLDQQMIGGRLRPHGEARENIVMHGVQAVRQAVRDSHFNDKCRGAAEAMCVSESEASRRVPDEIVLDAGAMADLRNAWIEGIDFDVFMAMGIRELLNGRRVNVITERRELLDGGKVAGLSEPRLVTITNDLGERLWPVDAELYADGGQLGQPSPVQVTYELVKPTVDEKIDEILKLMRQFGISAQDGVKISLTGVTSPEQAHAVATHIRAGEGIRVASESLVPLSRPVPSGWVVVGRSEEPGDLPRYLGPLEGWMDDPRRAVLFGNKEAAISAAATLNMVCPRDVDVAWMVYSHDRGNYVEQAQ